MFHRVSRRRFAGIAGAVIAGVALRPLVARAADPAPSGTHKGRMTADESLRDLMDGNARFVEGKTTGPRRSPAEFSELAEGQYPQAVIVGCADSRVAPEILFDVGVGDLFVVRVAGNVVSGAGASVKGSIEYAIAELNVPLIVVLGHSNCGAVKAAIKHIDAKDSLPGAINDLVELIKPAAAKARTGTGDFLDQAIRDNVLIGVDRLKALDPIVASRVKDQSVKVVGGVYDLRSGKVTMVG
jgi:carbonic anhydrase